VKRDGNTPLLSRRRLRLLLLQPSVCTNLDPSPQMGHALATVQEANAFALLTRTDLRVQCLGEWRTGGQRQIRRNRGST
jgi:hypothetical protein